VNDRDITPAGVTHTTLHQTVIHNTWNRFDSILFVYIAKDVAQ